MFRKKCPKCNEKIQNNYEFCPFCGKNLKSNEDLEDFGILGKNDFSESFSQEMFGNSFLDKLINNALKMIEKQMKSSSFNLNQDLFPKSNMKIKFMINGKEIPINNSQQPVKSEPLKIPNNLSEEKAKKISKLPRKEPKTIMKRFSGKLVYELSVPGVKKIQDIIINQLENSIEIKAISPKIVYSKTIKINLPLMKYSLNKGNLILELQAK